MTKKRFQKLTRAYFTRLNEWAKANNEKPMNMGRLYSRLEKLSTMEECIDETGRKWTRAEWWSVFEKHDNFGVGVKEGK